ncbi:MAG: hypothetical protein H6825_15265 [Planctomycetes bacterium]|nr:hypothetical protein [Planctomycetota bacterium]
MTDLAVDPHGIPLFVVFGSMFATAIATRLLALRILRCPSCGERLSPAGLRRPRFCERCSARLQD